MPTTTAIDHAIKEGFQRNGYCVIPGLIPAGVIAAVRARALDIAERPRGYPGKVHVIDPGRYPRPDQPYHLTSLQRTAQHEPSMKAMAEHENLAAAMADLLGGPVRLTTDQLGYKHGFLTEEQGGRSYYHQDAEYWKLPPGVGANCWIPLDAVGPDAITLALMPGSQVGGKIEEHELYSDDPPYGTWDGGFRHYQRRRIPVARIDAKREHVLRLQPGDGVFFGNYTWHRSEPNRSGGTLCFYAIAYQRSDLS